MEIITHMKFMTGEDRHGDTDGYNNLRKDRDLNDTYSDSDVLGLLITCC